MFLRFGYKESLLAKTASHLVLIAFVGLAAYSNTFDVPFQFDDFNNISENPVVRNIDNFLSSQEGFRNNPRRYIGHLSFALNYRFGGPDVTGYHVVNTAIHVINGILVYFLVILTFRTPFFGRNESGARSQESSPFTIHAPRFIALFAALLFVAHPVQTQAVTYIVQRLTSLAALFYLLSIVLYVKGRLVKSEESGVTSRESGEESNRDSAHCLVPAAYYFFSLLSAVLAMLTKEIAFTLPIMILLYEFTFFKSPLRKKLAFIVPILLTIVIIPASMMNVDRPLGEVLSDLSEKTRVQTAISRWDYLMTQMRVITTYIRLLFLPLDQNLDYDYPVSPSFSDPPVFLSFLFLSALFATAVYLLYRSRQDAIGEGQWESKEQRAESHRSSTISEDPRTAYSLLLTSYLRLIAFGILWFFIALSVESSVIPIVDVIFEHRVYLPSAGAFIAIATALVLLICRRTMQSAVSGQTSTVSYEHCSADMERPKGRDQNVKSLYALYALSLLLVVALAIAAYARNAVWKDNLTLWEDVVRKAPANARAHNNLGLIYNSRGMTDQAIEHLITALRLRPGYSDAHINLGIAYNAKGMMDQAMVEFMTVLSMNPDDPDAHNNLGISYVSRGMPDEAIKHYQIALRLRPDYAEAYNNLGVAYGNKGMLDEAIGYFTHAMRLKPDYYEAQHNLALAQEKMAGR
jgi:tetratricopeptide (TPR) repeat protein